MVRARRLPGEQAAVTAGLATGEHGQGFLDLPDEVLFRNPPIHRGHGERAQAVDAHCRAFRQPRHNRALAYALSQARQVRSPQAVDPAVRVDLDIHQMVRPVVDECAQARSLNRAPVLAARNPEIARHPLLAVSRLRLDLRHARTVRRGRVPCHRSRVEATRWPLRPAAPSAPLAPRSPLPAPRSARRARSRPRHQARPA